MDTNNAIVVFQGKDIRRVWYNNDWWFSVIDIVETLTESTNPNNYWSMLKTRESENGIQLSTFCVRLKLPSSDGKSYATDCANTKNMFRIIQTIPSQKAEPFKQWLAQYQNHRLGPSVGQRPHSFSFSGGQNYCLHKSFIILSTFFFLFIKSLYNAN